MEARHVHELPKSGIPLKVGKDATAVSLTELGPTAGVLHFATHADLDGEHPWNSQLVLNDKPFNLVEAFTLDLSQTDLVVLSAYRTNVARSGLEFATLARSFVLAGARTVVATL